LLIRTKSLKRPFGSALLVHPYPLYTAPPANHPVLHALSLGIDKGFELWGSACYSYFAMAKPRTTRTYGPIHFEDLDPHRFEDLIRELIYDFKDWQSIQSIGRTGTDEGSDIRAYERVAPSPPADEGENEEVEVHPMDGNLWMVQCKREKELGPKRIDRLFYGYGIIPSLPKTGPEKRD
jgi:hypothetical protein